MHNGIPEAEKENIAEEISEIIMVKNISKLMTNMKP